MCVFCNMKYIREGYVVGRPFTHPDIQWSLDQAPCTVCWKWAFVGSSEVATRSLFYISAF